MSWTCPVSRVRRIDVFSPFLRLVMAWNEGINFGIPLGGPMVLIGSPVVISVALVIWSMRRGSTAIGGGRPAGRRRCAGQCLGPGQRLGRGGRFPEHELLRDRQPFSFNVADIAIFVGAIWIAFRA